MGFHVCEYCKNETSSGDVLLVLTNGHVWEMPDMILHYIADHGYRPPGDFIRDVLRESLVEIQHCDRHRVWDAVVRVGYLSGDYPCGPTPPEFFACLWSLMRQAEKNGQRAQTRGL